MTDSQRLQQRTHAPGDTQAQLLLFAECVYSPADITEIRRLPSGRSTWHVASELAQQVDGLGSENGRGENIYVGINPRRSRGGRKTKDVVLARCLFCDFDKIEPDQARERIEASAFPAPTVFLASGHGAHAYWRLVEPVEDLPTWTRIQKNLSAFLGSDGAVHDPPRLGRLPGFTNHKPPPASCCIVDADPNRVYDLAELNELIPDRSEAETQRPDDTELSAMPPRGLDALTRAARYAKKWEGVGEGGRNSAAVYHAAQLTHDHALSDDEAWPILWAWNQRNNPPLPKDELRSCLGNGRRYGTNPAGCAARAPSMQTASAQSTDTLPEDPGPPWNTIQEVGARPTYGHGLRPITTGFDTLDLALRGGFRPESTYVIAGRTGSAKSTLAANIARKVALSGHRVLIFKLEESPTEFVWRMHAAAAQVPLERLLDGADQATDDREKLVDGWELLRDLPIRISDQRGLDAVQRISRKHAEHGGELIIIDQLSMISVQDAEIGYQTATAVSNSLHHLAQDLRLPILVVAQINRPASRHKADLTVNDIRDSGAIENDAAGVLLINRVRPLDGPPRKSVEPVWFLDILVGKNRYGIRTDPRSPLSLTWWPGMARIEDAGPLGAEVPQ